MRIALFAFAVWMTGWGFAQTPTLLKNIPFFDAKGQLLSAYWEGGFNNPYLAQVDLDRDGDKDLVILEKAEDRLYAYENGGTPNQVDYRLNNDLISGFPAEGISQFLHFEDINCDNVPDLFTYTPIGGAGIGVYTGSWVNNRLTFTLLINRLNDQSNNQIYADQTKKPDFLDINGDGDMDIILFEQFDGTIGLYENQRVERGNDCLNLVFKKVTNCWGYLCECSFITNEITLNYNNSLCFYSGLQGGGTQEGDPDTTVPGTRHAGSTITMLDVNKDGWHEILIGDAGYDNLIFLHNGPTVKTPVRDSLVAQDTAFPFYDVPVDFPVFPAAFYMDVDNDGLNDLLVTSFGPNSCALGGTADTSYNRGNIWWYRNVGTPVRDSFLLVSRNFLIDNVVDVGHQSAPLLVDVNYDGLTDLILSRCFAYDTLRQVQRGLVWYENTGTASNPQFTHRDDDWGGLAQYRWNALHPSLGDLDNDGDLDLIVGDYSGNIYVLLNAAGVGQPPAFQLYDTLYNGGYATPHIIDINDDSRPDFVNGEIQGRIQYWQNTGTEQAPAFTQIDPFFGQVDTRVTDFFGHCTPWMGDMDGDGELEAFSGSNNGTLFFYDNLENYLPSLPWIVTTDNYLDYPMGRLTALSVADLNGDGQVEIAVGNQRGGLSIFTTGTGVGMTSAQEPSIVQVYPNPATDLVQVRWQSRPDEEVSIRLLDMQGRTVWQQQSAFSRNEALIAVKNLSAGVYLLRWTQDDTQQVVPVVVHR